MISFVSNNCTGYLMFNKFKIKYNNPFIGSLFINDNDYIKFCNNINYYINFKPEFKAPSKKSDKYEQTN